MGLIGTTQDGAPAAPMHPRTGRAHALGPLTGFELTPGSRNLAPNPASLQSMASAPSSSRRERLLSWACHFTGGAAVGVGCFLILQVHFVRLVREEVGWGISLTRILGQATFLWRSIDEKLALALADVPESALELSHRVGLVLVVLGFPLCTPLLPRLLARRARRRKK